MSKIVLGKGLQALIPTGDAVEAAGNLRHAPLDQLRPNPMQPRRHFDDESLQQLAESFQRNGVMQPLLVRQDGSTFTIIAGERRYRAARLAGLNEVPVIVLDEVDDRRLLELALVENLQREDLNPLETAQAYRTLIEQCGLTQADLAQRVGKSRAAVTNLLRLLGLPERIKEWIRDGRLSEGHARALLAAESEAEMVRLAERILAQSLSVREVEREASSPRRRKLVPKRKLPALVEAEDYLKRLLGTSVRIIPGLKRGRIEIEYYSDEELDRLLDVFREISRT